MTPQGLHITIEDRQVRRLLAATGERARNWKPAANRIHAEMRHRVDSVFTALRGGGTHRGTTWKYFAPQYTRKTDGVVVPAWGGVPKLSGKGVVQGRKRPSGARIRQGDAIGQDTIHLRRGALLGQRLTLTELVMGPSISYAPAFQARRPFAFFNLPGDLSMMRQIVIDYFERG